MVEQAGIQYGLDWTFLRAPRIIEKDRLPLHAQLWRRRLRRARLEDQVTPEVAERCRAKGTAPLLRDEDGVPLKRNFVHVEDLVAAIPAGLESPRAARRLYDICMDGPVDYGEVADYLASTRGLPSIDIPSNFRSTWLDNRRARLELGWRPVYDLPRLIESAWAYQRGPEDLRRIRYPGQGGEILNMWLTPHGISRATRGLSEVSIVDILRSSA